MHRDLVLSLSVAAAVHGALLFGFSKNPSRAITIVDKIPVIRFVVDHVEPDPPLLEETEVKTEAPPSAPDQPVPTSPEPPPVVIECSFPIPPPPVHAFDRTAVTDIFVAPGLHDTEGRIGICPRGIIGAEFLDSAPRTRFQPAPSYPYQAKRDGVPGQVQVEFIVDETGHVREPHVVNSSNPMFDEPTLRAVAKWVFEPGKRDGRLVRFRMSVPVVFNLND